MLTDAVAGARSYAELSPRSPMLLREPLTGTTVRTFPGTLGHLPARFSQFSCMNWPRRLGRDPCPISPYKREAGGSNPPAPTKFVQLNDLFGTLIGGPGTIAGNHRCTHRSVGRVP